MNQRSTQFRSREERQRDQNLCEKHSKIAMPAVMAAYAVRKSAKKASNDQHAIDPALHKRIA